MNKHYFFEKGGLKNLLECSNSDDIINIAILEVLRNYDETKTYTDHILRVDGLIQFILSFLTSNNTSLKHASVSVLFGILEFDSNAGAQIIKHYQPKFISNLLNIGKTILISSTDLDIQRTLLGCLYALSTNIETNSLLFELNSFNELIHDFPSIIARYLACLGLAHLLKNESSRWNKKKKTAALSQISLYMKYYTPEETLKAENECGLLWSNVVPFYDLSSCFKEPVISQFGVYALNVLSFQNFYIQMIKSENLFNKIICLQWLIVNTKSPLHKHLNSLQFNLGPYQCPTLKEISEFMINSRYSRLLPAMNKMISTWNS